MKFGMVKILAGACGAMLLAAGTAAWAGSLEAIDGLVDRAEGFQLAGEIDAALEVYERAANLAEAAEEEDAVFALAYIRSQQGNLYWDAFQARNQIDSAWAALYYWDTERELYEAFGFPVGFMSLALTDISRAHLALAMVVDVEAHLEHASVALREARFNLPKDGIEAIQFILMMQHGDLNWDDQDFLARAR